MHVLTSYGMQSDNMPKQSYKPKKLISNTGQKSEISHNKYDLKSKHKISLPLQ